MHLVDGDRLGRRIIDDERVCDAIAAIGDTANIENWANRFAVLGDPTRLALLIAIRRAGPISVSDLGVATTVNNTTVSQALRYLRARGFVTAQRDGRVIRYAMADTSINVLLDQTTTRT